MAAPTPLCRNEAAGDLPDPLRLVSLPRRSAREVVQHQQREQFTALHRAAWLQGHARGYVKGLAFGLALGAGLAAAAILALRLIVHVSPPAAPSSTTPPPPKVTTLAPAALLATGHQRS